MLSGAVAGGVGRALSVGLPAGATVESACVAGKRLSAVATANGTALLPLPTLADNAVSFELKYRRPAGGNAFLRRLESPTPTLPGDPEPRRLWAFPDGSRPWRGAPHLARSPAPTARGEHRRIRSCVL